MIKRWLARLVVVVAGTVVAATIAEGFVRTFFPYVRDTVIPGHLFMIDNELGWKFRPTRTSIHRTRHFTVEYTINASGFRDKQRSGVRSPGTYRILLYGDSQVFGWGIPQAARFSDILERRIAGLQVWNRGVPGYGLDQEVLSYERDADSVVFDEAMFFVGGGTLGRIHEAYLFGKYKPLFSYGPDGTVIVKPIPKSKTRIMSLLYEALSPFYLPYFLQKQLAIAKASFAGQRPLRKGISEQPKYMDKLAKEILYRAHLISRRKNQRLSVLANDLTPPDRRELRRFCQENSIDFLELPAPVAATSTTNERMDLVLGLYDRHWNAKADAMIADRLEQAIRRRLEGSGPNSRM